MLLFGDFETYYDSDYTLKKLTTEAYVRDPRFESICFCGYFPYTKPVRFVNLFGHDNIKRWMDEQDWSRIDFVAHHCQFDGLILSHHYNVYPRQLGCTLSMARTQSRERIGSALSLQKLSEKLGKQPKTVNYAAFKGIRPAAFSPSMADNLMAECLDDCFICYAVFKDFIDNQFPIAELEIIDLTMKMFTTPKLRGDVDAFHQMAGAEIERKNAILAELGVTREQLGSNTTFQKILEDLGVEVGMKKGAKGPIPAIAKTDEFMQELLENDDEYIAELASARLQIKSNITETRAARMAAIASRGAIPIYLRYCGAHTTRWSGGDKQNSQNFKRKGSLRSGILAPVGHKLIIIDYDQIECRFVLRLAAQQDQLDIFRQGRDIYKETAARLYQVPVEEVTDAQRGFGKLLVLSCGFGAGDRTIQRTAANGAYGAPLKITIAQAGTAKKLYREINNKVKRLWVWGNSVLECMLNEYRDKYQKKDIEDNNYPYLKEFEDSVAGLFKIEGKKIILPNGLVLDYSSLAYHPEQADQHVELVDNNIMDAKKDLLKATTQTAINEITDYIKEMEEQKERGTGLLGNKLFINGEWVKAGRLTVKHNHVETRIYGGKFIQNIVEGLHRNVVSDAMLAVKRDPRVQHVHLVLQGHDELVYICPDELVDDTVPILEHHMVNSQGWLTDMPLSVKTTVGDCYAKQ